MLRLFPVSVSFAVGGSVDKACSMEAMLRALSARKQDLRIEQSKIDSHFITLMNDLQTSLSNDEDLTVIGGETFSKADNEVLIQQATGQESDEEGETSMEVVQQQDLQEIFKPHLLERADSPPVLQHLGLGCFSHEVLDPLFARNSPATLLNEVRQTLSFTDETSERESPRSLYPTSSHPSPGAMSEGARAWRERNGHPESTSVDFRTGRSGHMALLSAHAPSHPHEYLRPAGRARKMSSHSGLTVGRRSRPPNLPAFTPGRGISESKEEHASRTP